MSRQELFNRSWTLRGERGATLTVSETDNRLTLEIAIGASTIHVDRTAWNALLDLRYSGPEVHGAPDPVEPETEQG